MVEHAWGVTESFLQIWVMWFSIISPKIGPWLRISLVLFACLRKDTWVWPACLLQENFIDTASSPNYIFMIIQRSLGLSQPAFLMYVCCAYVLVCVVMSLNFGPATEGKSWSIFGEGVRASIEPALFPGLQLKFVFCFWERNLFDVI